MRNRNWPISKALLVNKKEYYCLFFLPKEKAHSDSPNIFNAWLRGISTMLVSFQ